MYVDLEDDFTLEDLEELEEQLERDRTEWKKNTPKQLAGGLATLFVLIYAAKYASESFVAWVIAIYLAFFAIPLFLLLWPLTEWRSLEHREKEILHIRIALLERRKRRKRN